MFSKNFNWGFAAYMQIFVGHQNIYIVISIDHNYRSNLTQGLAMVLPTFYML